MHHAAGTAAAQERPGIVRFADLTGNRIIAALFVAAAFEQSVANVPAAGHAKLRQT